MLAHQVASIESCTQKVHNWLLNNGLHLNPSKSEAIAFFNPRSKPLESLAESIASNSLDGSTIKLQSFIKNLGVYLDLECLSIGKFPKHARLHWLPIRLRIHYKLCMLMHQVCFGHSPTYLADMMTATADLPGCERLFCQQFPIRNPKTEIQVW